MDKQRQNWANSFIYLNVHYNSFAIILISTFFTVGLLFVAISCNLHMAYINFACALFLSIPFFSQIKMDFNKRKNLFKILLACIGIQSLSLLGFWGESSKLSFHNIHPLKFHLLHLAVIGAFILLTFCVISITNKVTMYIRYLGNIAYEDPVTKLPNWCYFNNIISNRLKLSRHKLLLMAIWDIQSLDSLNSKYGVSHGNQILQDITMLLKQNTPTNAWIARAGGSKFVMIVPKWNEMDLNRCISKCYQELDDIAKKRQTEHEFSLIAYEVFNHANFTLDSIFRSLNFTLQHARLNGRVGIIKHEASISNDYELEDLIISNVENAIANGDFTIKFQGEFNLISKKTCGFEALTRWDHEMFKAISPGYFVPIINRSRYMKVFNKHILTLSMQKFSEIQSFSPTQFTLSLNISPLYLLDNDFPHEVEQIAFEEKISLDCIILEVTEDVLIRDYEKAKLHIDQLRSLGIRFSLDDFGTGFSSLSHLNFLDIQEIKLDKEIIHSAATSERSFLLLDGIAKLARNMNCDLVAEGVETQKHYQLAEKIGCTLVQGYYVDMPSTVESIKSKILDGHMIV